MEQIGWVELRWYSPWNIRTTGAMAKEVNIPSM
jgi:hypothetical protein